MLPETWNIWLETNLPDPWMRASAIVIAAVVLGFLMRTLLGRVLLRIANLSGTDADDRVVAILRQPIFISIVLWGLFLAEKTLPLPEASARISAAMTLSLGLITWTVASFQLTDVVLGSAQRLATRKRWLDERTVPLIENLARIFLFGLTIYLFLQIWDLDAAPWLASAGVAGLALGFAAKDTLANVFGGLFIIIDSPYKIGDYVNLDSGERGEVTRIGLRSTRLLTRDDIEVTIPNAQIAAAKIINEAGGRWELSRVRVPVGVAYGADIGQVRAVLMQAAERVDLVVDQPEPRVRFRALGDSSLDFELLAWIAEPWQRGQAIDKLLTEIYEGLQRAGISIPFPQRDLHISGPIRVVQEPGSPEAAP